MTQKKKSKKGAVPGKPAAGTKKTPKTAGKKSAPKTAGKKLVAKTAGKKSAAKSAPGKSPASKSAKKISRTPAGKKTSRKKPTGATARKKAPKKSIKKAALPPAVTWDELYEMEIVLRSREWNCQRDVDTIEGLNRRLAFGGFEEVIRDTDRAYGGAIWKIAGEILSHRDRIKLVIVAGPSSSGKTTTTMKLCEALRTAGERLQLLPLDNYFWNLENQPRDEHGDYDFETPQALDIASINRNLRELLDGKETEIPIYNFKTGRREEQGMMKKLNPGDLLVVEGLHGLHSELTRGIARRNQFRVYIESICQLTDRDGAYVPWTDIRLLRRMVRDSLHRNYTPVKTVGHWHYVRAAEKKYIVPFIKEADAVINGYLPYELPVHKKYMYESLRQAASEFQTAPGREDALKRAVRVLGWLEQVNALENDAIIPDDSLLREFIGGSIYQD